MIPRVHCLSHSPTHGGSGGGGGGGGVGGANGGGPVCPHSGGGDRSIPVEGSPRGMSSPSMSTADRMKFQAASGRGGADDSRGGMGGYIPEEGDEDDRYKSKVGGGGGGGHDPFFLSPGEQDLINKLPKTENHYL